MITFLQTGEVELVAPHLVPLGIEWHFVRLEKKDWLLDHRPMITIRVEHKDGDEWKDNAHVTLLAGAWPSRRGASDNVDSQVWRIHVGHRHEPHPTKEGHSIKIPFAVPAGRMMRVVATVLEPCWFGAEMVHR